MKIKTTRLLIIMMKVIRLAQISDHLQMTWPILVVVIWVSDLLLLFTFGFAASSFIFACSTFSLPLSLLFLPLPLPVCPFCFHFFVCSTSRLPKSFIFISIYPFVLHFAPSSFSFCLFHFQFAQSFIIISFCPLSSTLPPLLSYLPVLLPGFNLPIPLTRFPSLSHLASSFYHFASSFRFVPT